MSDAKTNSVVVHHLTKVLQLSADVYASTHSAHWNVKGANFFTFHEMFSLQYNEQWAALDEIAERLRAIGAYAPSGGLALYNTTKAATGGNEPTGNAKTLLQGLIQAQELLIESIESALKPVQEAGDEGSFDILIGRLQAHQKQLWMLKSSL